MLPREYHLAHHRALDPCCICPANNSDIPWKGCRIGLAAWLALLHTWLTFVAANPNMHIILRRRIVSHYGIAPDYIHCKYLGVDQYIAGAVLWLLVYVVLPGSARQITIQTSVDGSVSGGGLGVCGSGWVWGNNTKTTTNATYQWGR